jgi:ribose-phosphate pyrophosphokinase
MTTTATATAASTAPESLVLAFADSQPQGRLLARHLGAEWALIDCHRFPDGETLITLPPALPPTVVILRSLHDPNSKLVELYLAICTARSLGCQRVILVAPYLCYLRQDKVFQPGQGISQRYIGQLLSRWVDAVITVDPHLHRIANLDEALPHCRTIALSAAPLLGDYLRQQHDGSSLLLGPDGESRQWVAQVAAQCACDFAVASKVRHGDRNVAITLPPGDFTGRHIVLVDDVISSGHTLITAARLLLAAGAASISALCTHALLAPGAEAAMAAAGIHPLASSNTIAHGSNRVDLSPLYAEAVQRLCEELP